MKSPYIFSGVQRCSPAPVDRLLPSSCWARWRASDACTPQKAKGKALAGGKRIIGLLAVVALLQACSAAKIFYNQTPELAYWYLDGYLDLGDMQSLQVRGDLSALQAWHRRTQLPVYLGMLQKLQKDVLVDVEPEKVCRVLSDVRGQVVTVLNQLAVPATTLTTTIKPDQITHLTQKFAKGNAQYRDDFLDVTTKALTDKRYKDAVGRAEMLYGSLDAGQLSLLRTRTEQSGFDASVAYTERLRRQEDALRTLRSLTATPATAGASATSATAPPQAAPNDLINNTGAPSAVATGNAGGAIRGLFARAATSPDAKHRSYVANLTQQACLTASQLHNSTSPAQRGKAVQTLQGYERDIQDLMSQKS